jgi:protein-tyrosine phosphatase
MNINTFSTVFDHAAKLIRDQLKKKRYVVVHCYAGINRSVTSILRYVQLYTDMDWEKARDYIRRQNETRRQTVALTNQTFENYLYELEPSQVG